MGVENNLAQKGVILTRFAKKKIAHSARALTDEKKWRVELLVVGRQGIAGFTRRFLSVV